MGDWDEFATDTMVVRRRTAPNQPIATVYTGPADVQAPTGHTYYDAGGVIQVYDALAFVYPIAGVLPTVLIDDTVVVTSMRGTVTSYRVVHIDEEEFDPAHLEIRLRKGNIGHQQAT